MRAADTSPEAHARQIQLYREAGTQRRAEMVDEMSELVRELARAGVRSRHPEFSEEQVTAEVRRIFYGAAANGK